MSHRLELRSADLHEVLSYLGSEPRGEGAARLLGTMRETAAGRQRGLEERGTAWALAIPAALDQLVAGRPEGAGESAAAAYVTALQIVVAGLGSEPDTVGEYTDARAHFAELDAELDRVGVPAELRPTRFLFAEFPFPLPDSASGPALGHLPLVDAAEIIDAYRAALDHVHPPHADTLAALTAALEYHHEEWDALREEHEDADDQYIFFSIT
ncbi:DUF7691 family protein [Nocardia sp. NPDC003693]